MSLRNFGTYLEVQMALKLKSTAHFQRRKSLKPHILLNIFKDLVGLRCT
jgi:hypothetical protein